MARLRISLFATCLLAIAPLSAAETIGNDQLSVSWEKGRYVLMCQGKPFASCRMNTGATAVSISSITDVNFGKGQAIEAATSEGNRQTVKVFPGVPFALFSSSIVNHESTAVVLNKVPLVDAQLEPGAALDQLVGLGTGGLYPIASNPPSFAWMTIADKKAGTGIIAGWLTHEHGTGVVTTRVDGGHVGLEGRLEYGRLRIEAGASATSETFALGWFADARMGMEAWADAVAKHLAITLPPMPIVYCTWYDNVHGGSGNETSLAELASFAARELKPYGFSCVQIDDGWQLGDSKGNGSAKNFSQYNPHGAYGKGMKATADNLRSLGLTAGLWILPFGGSWNDPFFAAHQDWFVKRQEDGKPYDTAWGGTSLDMTEPGARAFVAGEIRQAVQDWGYHYLKLDGLSTGIGVKPMYVEDSWKEDNLGDAVFHDPSKTNIDAFRDGLRLVREAAGRDTFILGCCAPQNMRSYAGVFGLVNAMRMGPDNDGSWSGWKGSSDFGSRNYHLNGRIWWSDPDPMYVRPSIPLESARCIASWNSISGQMISVSDWLPTLPVERLDIIRRTIPGHGVTARPIDLFRTWPPRQWLVSDLRPDRQRRDVLGLFNWTYQTEQAALPVAGLGLPPAEEYIAFDFWNRVFLKPFKDAMTMSVPGAACRILAVRPLLPHPFLISTSRHVTQGIVEVKQEAWDDRLGTLTGTSAVVAGDAYELRVVACSPSPGWTLTGAAVADGDTAVGVTISTSAANGLVRVLIAAPISREVTWTLHFAPAKTTLPPARIEGATATFSEDGDELTLTWKPIDGTWCEVDSGLGSAITNEIGRYSVTDVPPDQELHIRLTAVSWSGQRGETNELVVRTPKPRARPPLPPKPTLALGSLKALEARTGYGSVNANSSVNGKPLSIDGVVYANGVGVHAESLLVYEVKKDYRRFVAIVGVDDEVKDSPACVVFRVIAEIGNEKRQLAASPKLRGRRPPASWYFDVTLPEKCTRVRLVVDDAGDGNNSDHADWVDTGFITAGP